MKRFEGQVMLITGAAQGIGRRLAERAGDEGAALVLVDRAEHVHQVARELGEQGVEVLALNADLETWEGAESAIKSAIERFGRLDVLVNNVGGTIWAKPYTHYSPEQVEAEVRRSLFPTLWCCRAALPHLIDSGGNIVNVSSVATRGVNRVPYASAKGGVNAMTVALAIEMAEHGVRVNATAPGGTEAPPRLTPRNAEPQSEQDKLWYQQLIDQTLASSLMHRYGTLDEQVGPILFLASRDASYITGTVVPVAGGDLG
ncbi:1,6-dihydroxycyclohexa-2,4-diene-1-carboxylate dehydrogenase [Halomonas litopenaei]|uniref:1,6-dihydroxycyclohexa-2,4-diene-1-carboxylate dehydrogenase n=1 Tax=Halomonas litopenaei TaxID=2109328 RepID=A0ABX5J1W9_9GAMM|nr:MULTISPECIES: benzoate diol dehydrogenase BenD [Halomonas]PTL93117.1 1,6-dihydroxycyclohexa-2,4-diene-1-carboxylate dehydrogenase [Halomonas sp. SYSU XM8]PTL95980.1 1,6-dihydroxycyclohexa-2,4-diene-1-carboxylate dehydrogenase [Halomonas litopenaei]